MESHGPVGRVTGSSWWPLGTQVGVGAFMTCLGSLKASVVRTCISMWQWVGWELWYFAVAVAVFSDPMIVMITRDRDLGLDLGTLQCSDPVLCQGPKCWHKASRPMKSWSFCWAAAWGRGKLGLSSKQWVRAHRSYEIAMIAMQGKGRLGLNSFCIHH